MAVLRLVQRDDPCAWIWSPIEISDELAKEVEAKAGPIKFIVSPNKFHHFFLKSWADKYPSAEVWGPPGLKRRKVAEGIRFNQTFGEDEHPEPEFLSEIDYVVVKGSYVLHEVEFFHKPSKTAIINDLIQRHTEHLNGWKGFLMKLDGLAGEHGSTPRDWRFTFWLAALPSPLDRFGVPVSGALQGLGVCGVGVWHRQTVNHSCGCCIIRFTDH